MIQIVACLENDPILDNTKAREAKTDLKRWKEEGLPHGKLVEASVLNAIFNELKTHVDEKIDQLKIIEFKTTVFDELRNFKATIEEQVQNQDYKISNIVNQVDDKIAIVDNRVDEIETRVDEIEIQAKKSEQDKNAVKYYSNIPNKNKHFFGRSEVLNKINDMIQVEPYIVTISGLGGVGKTSVALEAARGVEPLFKGGMYWITADSNETICHSLHEIAQGLLN